MQTLKRIFKDSFHFQKAKLVLHNHTVKPEKNFEKTLSSYYRQGDGDIPGHILEHREGIFLMNLPCSHPPATLASTANTPFILNQHKTKQTSPPRSPGQFLTRHHLPGKSSLIISLPLGQSSSQGPVRAKRS
jgi:hypothetical protein